MRDKEKTVLEKLIENSEPYEPENELERIHEKKNKIANTFNNNFQKYKEVFPRLYEQNSLINLERKTLERRIKHFESEIGKQNDLLDGGSVVAIDGTTNFAMDEISFIKYFSIIVGSVSYKKGFNQSASCWDTALEIEEIHKGSQNDLDYIINVLEIQKNKSVPKTDFMLFKEREYAYEIEEKYVFLDGPIFSNPILETKQGRELYQKMFSKEHNKGKKYIGIIKNITENSELDSIAGILESGEVIVVKTTYHDLKYKDIEIEGLDFQRFLKGVFKIGNKGYGFEVFEDDLEDMMKLVFNDCSKGALHEIPFLLDLIDKEIKKYNSSNGFSEVIKSEILKNASPEDYLKILLYLENERNLR